MGIDIPGAREGGFDARYEPVLSSIFVPCRRDDDTDDIIIIIIIIIMFC